MALLRGPAFSVFLGKMNMPLMWDAKIENDEPRMDTDFGWNIKDAFFVFVFFVPLW